MGLGVHDVCHTSYRRCWGFSTRLQNALVQRTLGDDTHEGFQDVCKTFCYKDQLRTYWKRHQWNVFQTSAKRFASKTNWGLIGDVTNEPLVWVTRTYCIHEYCFAICPPKHLRVLLTFTTRLQKILHKQHLKTYCKRIGDVTTDRRCDQYGCNPDKRNSKVSMLDI